jgi:hypothetical protein
VSSLFFPVLSVVGALLTMLLMSQGSQSEALSSWFWCRQRKQISVQLAVSRPGAENFSQSTGSSEAFISASSRQIDCVCYRQTDVAGAASVHESSGPKSQGSPELLYSTE